ncbi:hypothetical protein C5748_22660 [Phyllobacterium phragmitis]|uniref:Methyltransferase FkbM domain-containing protein n=1 Tax=Phyllobacterium phragmitis TaxID=2670329 RepID=A0A2S9IKW5_9HYPH|nr:FkbM family methyltransferase [Phyllobacterium phragmitis]PRD41169.1 hypothetical protein C5748_22660 [Phyllobacterium phragmitis]
MELKETQYQPCLFHTLAGWKPQYSTMYRPSPDGGFVINDGTDADWHLIRVWNNLYAGEIKLTATVQPVPGCNADFYIHHWGNIDICAIGADGKVVNNGMARSVACKQLSNGRLEIEVEFENRHNSISVGLTRSKVGPRYQGENRDQWQIFDLRISRRDFAIDDVDKLVVVDVGARGGARMEWLGYGKQIEFVLVEPEPAAAESLRKQGCTVIEAGLSNVQGKSPLYITRYPACSSLLRPNDAVLSRYHLAPIFDVVATTEITTERYDGLYAAGKVPAPDVIKIDVQGLEYEILEGCGDLLSGCSAIELEAHFYPLYLGQKLIGDIVTYLDGFDFALRKLSEQANFDGERVEFNAFFTKRGQLSSTMTKKVAFVERLWRLQTSDRGQRIARRILQKIAA